MNMNIKYLIKLKELNSRFCQKIKSKGKALNTAQDQGQDSANFRFVDLFEAVPRMLFTF
jgi:hypothetical protein